MHHKTANYVTFFILLLLVVLGVISYSKANAPFLSFSQDKKTFNNINLELSFKYPQDFDVRETKADKITYIDVFPKSLSDQFEPKFIEIIAMPSDSNAALDQVVMDSYPDLKKNDLIKLRKFDAEGVQIVQTQNIAERFILSYLRFDKMVYLVKFYQKYYSPDNPYSVVNNSSSLSDYYGILNSMVFTKIQ